MDNGVFNNNDKVLVADDSLKKVFTNRYKFLMIDNFEDAQLLQITETVK